MVRRLALITAALVATGAGTASAANRVVGVGDHRWALPEVGVDRGESVTWVFAGPDLRHSITPVDAATGLPDSDPGGGGVRTKRVGERFAITFTAPGAYDLRCRLHGIVGGRVTVSETPGDPAAASPDPAPVLRPDRRAPRLRDVRATPARLRFALDEAARVAVDLVGVRRGRDVLLHSATIRGHVGRNAVTLRGGLRPRARGTYRLVLRPRDAAGNRGPSRSATVRR